MAKIWRKIEDQSLFGGIFYLILAISWIFITINLGRIEKIQQSFEIQAFLQSKILLVAVVYLGWYLFFPHYRNLQRSKWLAGICTIMIIGAQFFKLYLFEETAWNYYVLLILDAVLWSFFLSTLLQNILLVINFWLNLSNIDPSNISDLWRLFWKENMKIGFLTTILMSLAYYYLVSCFLVDSVIYSYVLLIPVIVFGIILYWTLFHKVQNWAVREIYQIDQELAAFISWKDWQDNSEFGEKASWIDYLFQLRNYFFNIKKPNISVITLLCYLLFIGFILLLPYLFGIAIEV